MENQRPIVHLEAALKTDFKQELDGQQFQNKNL